MVPPAPVSVTFWTKGSFLVKTFDQVVEPLLPYAAADGVVAVVADGADVGVVDVRLVAVAGLAVAVSSFVGDTASSPHDTAMVTETMTRIKATKTATSGDPFKTPVFFRLLPMSG